MKAGDTNVYFSEHEILDLFCQIAMAIKTCHNGQVLHRDIKAQNVFLTKDMQVKLGDFGVSRVLEHSKSKAVSTIGTPYYLSPEIINGETYRYESDIWSLGILLYYMAALKYPFVGKDMFGLYK